MKLPKTNLLYGESEIRRRVDELGKQLTARYDDGKQVVAVCVLRGAVMFFTDLMKSIDLDTVTYAFVQAQSYECAGDTMRSGGEVQMLQQFHGDVEDKHVLIVEDIIDSGRTVEFLRNYFTGKGAASIATACLLDKPMTRAVDARADYVAFTLERPAFIIGYGLDCDQRYRNLNGIYEVITD